jgi:hypothetical protein
MNTLLLCTLDGNTEAGKDFLQTWSNQPCFGHPITSVNEAIIDAHPQLFGCSKPQPWPFVTSLHLRTGHI